MSIVLRLVHPRLLRLTTLNLAKGSFCVQTVHSDPIV